MRSRFTDSDWREYCPKHSIESIAKHFGVTESTARTRCSLLGIYPLRKSDIRYQGLAEYMREHTLKEAAFKYRTTYSAIISYLRSHKIPYFRKCELHKSPDTVSSLKKRAILYLSEDFSVLEISSIVGCVPEVVEKVCRLEV